MKSARIYLLALIFVTSGFIASAQTLQTLSSFAGTNGANPYASLTLGNDGNFYGTTYVGGTAWTNLGVNVAYGTVFKVTTNGILTTLASFNKTNGAYPQAALTVGSDGNFYGTTWAGGGTNGTPSPYGQGTLFRVTTNGVLTSLLSFHNSETNGDDPKAPLTLGNDGNFYGTTSVGGGGTEGAIFEVTTNGVLTTLYTFSGPDGAVPRAALTVGNDGNFYGTTAGGNGSGSSGTVFKVTTNGVLITLVYFNGANGAAPYAAMTLGVDGNFYGTTEGGGITNSSHASGMGTVFTITTNGALTVLVYFNNTNGANPYGGLTLGNDGSFYGTTYAGGSAGDGTVFHVTTNGLLTTLASFTGANGGFPMAGLILGNDGNFYGTTGSGGSGVGGTVFRLSLSPVIGLQPLDQTNYVGSTVIFTVNATNQLLVSYQWQKNGTNLFNGGNISGANTNTLTITGISDSDAASYSVIVSNSFGGVTSSNATLTVNDFPFVAMQPSSQSIAVGSNVTFTASAYGSPPFIFQWYYNNSPVGSPTSGTNVSSYMLSNVQTNQSGNYSVQVINGHSSVMSSNATLTVVAPPIITTQPSSRTNNAASTATFSVIASSVSALSYQWQINGTNLANGGKISGATSNTLTITNVSDNDAAIYLVTVSNLAGSVTSSNATLTVLDPPSITTQPASQRIVLGSIVSFNVSVSGITPFYYQWRFNAANILNATNAVYAIQAVITNNTGNYSVVITNLVGSVTSSNALLTVLVSPTIALQFLAGYPFLNLNGMLSNNFVVQYSTNLANTNWINLLSVSNLSSSPYQFLDPAGIVPPARFYRALMQ